MKKDSLFIFTISNSNSIKYKLRLLLPHTKYPNAINVHDINAMLVSTNFKIIKSERPSVVISTGAAPGILSCFWGKLLGAKVVWLDSIANTEKLSMSGRMVRPFADLVLTQWPDVAEKYKNVECVGAVI